MQGNRSRDTKPELALRSAAHAAGLRYWVARRPIPTVRRTADLLFPARRVVVFVDGCFWHRCKIHFKLPSTNRDYWSRKIDRNVERDRETDQLLADAGWVVVRIWEHENPNTAVAALRRVISGRVVPGR